MGHTRSGAIAAAMLAAALAATTSAGPTDDQALFAVGGVLDAVDRSKLEAGSPVVEVLPAEETDLAVFGAVRVDAGPKRLTAWVREIEQFQRGRYVSALQRFSDPPRLDDLAALTLDEEDMDALRRCRPGDCKMKLSGAEIVELRQAIADAGVQWKDAALEAFRRVMLARARDYLANGLRSTAPYHDRKEPVSPDVEFAAIAARFGFDTLLGSDVIPHLQSYPHVSDEGVESFLYWSKEALGGGKRIVSITHTAIFHGTGLHGGGILVAAKQVFATHYLTGSLSLSLISGHERGPRYFLYIRRFRADVLEGTFGGIIRRIVQRRVRSEAPAVLDELRRRLESGDPNSRSGS